MVWYNKFRNNLFGLLYRLKKLERCVVQGRPKSISVRVIPCLKNMQLVAGKGKCLKCSRISLDIPMKIWEAVLKSWDIELFSDIGLISEQFVCYPLYYGKIKSYFGNFNRFITGNCRWKVSLAFFCRLSLDIPMKTSLAFLNRGKSQLFDDIIMLRALTKRR